MGSTAGGSPGGQTPGGPDGAAGPGDGGSPAQASAAAASGFRTEPAPGPAATSPAGPASVATEARPAPRSAQDDVTVVPNADRPLPAADASVPPVGTVGPSDPQDESLRGLFWGEDS
jgi:hypothetical protein